MRIEEGFILTFLKLQFWVDQIVFLNAKVDLSPLKSFNDTKFYNVKN